MTVLSVIIDDNYEYSLDDGTYGLLVGHEGWGMSPSKRISSQGPQQHGATDEGQRLQSRFGTLLFFVPNLELQNMYNDRESFLELFHPDNSPVLKWNLGKGTRYFDCVYAGELSMPWQPRDWGNANLALTLKCPDPTCYDPEVNITTFVGETGTAGFQVPWVVPSFVGSPVVDDTQIISYEGTSIEYPEIEIAGPIDDPIIINTENEYKLDFTGLSMGVGEKRIIDLRYGYKTVKDGSGGNQIPDLTNDSDLVNWRLERKRVYESFRSNPISVSATGASSATRFVIRWKNRYIGI